MSKTEDFAWKALDAFGAISGNPYMHCPICGKKCYSTGIEGNGVIAYSAIRKTVGRIKYVGKKLSRYAADNFVHPTYEYYCHRCDYTWKSSECDG